jgi:hypothetical protein
MGAYVEDAYNVLRKSTRKILTAIGTQKNHRGKSVTDHSCRVTLPYKRIKVRSEKNQERRMAKKIKKIVNIRLRPDQEERINAIVERSAILDTSKFVRIAVDWLLRSDIGEVIKTIVHDENHFPDYQIPKKATGRKKRSR